MNRRGFLKSLLAALLALGPRKALARPRGRPPGKRALFWKRLDA
jgi:hypothetical protein